MSVWVWTDAAAAPMHVADSATPGWTDAPYRSGSSQTWLKSKNSASEAVRREREEEWR
jgi:hypothetical protein